MTLLTKQEIEALLDPFASRSGTEALRKLRDAAPDLARIALDALARLADAEAAQALVSDSIAHECEQHAAYYLGAGDPRKRSAFLQAAKEARALAPASGVAALAALREASFAEGVAHGQRAMEAIKGPLQVIDSPELADLRVRLAVAEGRVAALTEAATLAMSDMEVAFKPGTSVIELIRLGTGATLRLRAALATVTSSENK